MTETYQYSVRLRGLMKGHTNWVTSLATTPESNDMVLSGSRDKSIIIWDLKSGGDNSYALPKRALRGHSHYVQDVVISSDGQFALSGSWDGTLRLWDLNTGMTTRPTFVGHTKDVLSVAFSSDNRQIVSGSRDRTIKLWNTLGDCKYTLEEQRHNDWVSCVRFSPVLANPLQPEAATPLFVSGGWDKTVKVWNLQKLKLLTNLHGHTGYINSVTVSPDGSLCASGGKDQTAMLWDLTEGKHLYSLDAGSVINALVFSPNRYWLCAATDDGVKIWDLESKSVVASLNASAPDFYPSSGAAGRSAPQAISLAWSADGNTLFAGYTDGLIRVWAV